MSRFAPRIAAALLAFVLATPALTAQQKASSTPAPSQPSPSGLKAHTTAAPQKMLLHPGGKASLHRTARNRVKPKPEPAPQPAPPPQPPPPPPTPEQMPPTPPQVSYQNGMLSIVAQNSTLGDILSAVRARTGAAIELPPGAGRERVAMTIGPAPPRDALDTLLSGSRFNYLILGPEDNPEGLQRVILLTRTAEAATATAANQPSARPTTPPVNNADEGEGESDDESAAGDDSNPPVDVAPPEVPPQQTQPQAQPPTGQAPPPEQQLPATPGQPQTNPQQNPTGQPQTKTPEQLLQELQRMQQQQQQQQQQQGQPQRIPPEQQHPESPPDQQQNSPADQPTSPQPPASPPLQAR